MSCVITFAGTELELHAEGFAWFPRYKILCASDIHLEKGSFFQRFSTLLPPYDTRQTLQRLGDAFAKFQPELFVSLGDAFHDVAALARMQPADRAALDALIASTPRWVWVEGNHDPHMDGVIGGERQAEFAMHGITFRHIAEPGKADWELSGHFHPKARVIIRGHSLRLACFVAAGSKLLLPAFGSYTGGLDVNDPAIASIMPIDGRKLFLLHKERVFPWLE